MRHDYVVTRPPRPKSSLLLRVLAFLFGTAVTIVVAAWWSSAPPHQAADQIRKEFAEYRLAYVEQGHEVSWPREMPVTTVLETLPTLSALGHSLDGWQNNPSILVGNNERLLIRVVTQQVCSDLNGGQQWYTGDQQKGLALMISEASVAQVKCYSQSWGVGMSGLFKGLFLGHPQAELVTPLAFLRLPALTLPVNEQI